MKNWILLFCLAASTWFAVSARAQVTVSTSPNNGFVGFIGVGGDSFGQSITVPVGDTELQSFTFDHTSSSPALGIQIYIYAFNNTTHLESGSALYTSGVINVPTSQSNLTINPGIVLSAGHAYVVLATADGVTEVSPNSPGGNASLYLSSTSYSGGSFVYTTSTVTNGFTSSAFATFLESAFSATFVPGIVTFSTADLTPNQQSVLGPINAGITGGNNAPHFTALYNALNSLPSSQLPGALDQLSPIKFGNFTSKTAFNNAVFQTEYLDNYLAGQRIGPGGTFIGGNGSIDASGLSINDPSYDPALAMVHSRLMAWNPGPANGLISDVGGPSFGGTDMKDVKNMSSGAPESYNPWNVFVQGNVILAQGFSQADTPHFNDNTESVTIGADYRFTPHFLLGLSAGYGHTDAQLDNFGSTATVDSYSPGIYASYADKGWYANFNGNYVYNSYTQTRQIDFLGQAADSATQGNQGTASLDGGYDFHSGAFTYGPLAGVQYTHLSVHGYDETGSVADLSVSDSDADSLRSRLGGRVAYSLVHCGMTFTPHLDASWQHEFLDQARGISSQFGGTGLGSFNVRTENPSRDSALVDAGLNADINRSVTVFGDYEVQAGQSNYFGQSVQAGVKIGF